jgi:hypothetical protein
VLVSPQCSHRGLILTPLRACSEYKPSQNRITLDFDAVQYQLSGQALPPSPDRSPTKLPVPRRLDHVHSPLRTSTYPLTAKDARDDNDDSDDEFLTPSNAQEAQAWLEAMESDPANNLSSTIDSPAAAAPLVQLRRASLPVSQSSEGTRQSGGAPASPKDPKERAQQLRRSLQQRRSIRNSATLPMLLKHAHSSPQLARAINKTTV